MNNQLTKYAEPDADFPVVRGPFDYSLPERLRPLPMTHSEYETVARQEAQQAETRNTAFGVVGMIAVAVVGAKVAAGATVAPLVGGAICCAVIVALFRRNNGTLQRYDVPQQSPNVTVTVETKVNVTIQ